MRGPCFKQVFAWKQQSEASQSAFEQENEEHHSNIKEEFFSSFMCERVKTGCFVELGTTRRLDTVVKNSCAGKEVHAANLGVPTVALRDLFGSVNLGICWRRIKK